MSNENTAAPELAAVEIHGMDRGAFVMKSALAVGTVYGVAAVGPFVGKALAETGDVGILNFALTLEYLEAEFYVQGRKLQLRNEVAQFARLAGQHEQEHVEALSGTIEKLGGTPVKKPMFKFPISNEANFLKLAQTLEDTGVGAYNGAAPAIQSTEVLAAAGSIVQIEARHAAVIRLLNGDSPAPASFDEALMKAKVLAAVKPLIRA